MYEIKYSKDFNKEFVKIQHKAEAGNSDERFLLDLINKATAKLAKDKEAGIKVPRKLWPKEYIKNYGITNLWKYNLDNYWRLTYTITGNEIEFFLIYLEVMDHHSYNKRFGYRKK